MAITASTGKSLNPLSSAVAGGLIPAANVIVRIDSWADPLEPRRTPVLTRAKKGGAVDQVKNEWGQNYHIPISGALADDMTNNQTTVPLASGEGKYIQKWHVLEVIDYYPGTSRLNYATREEIIVGAQPDGTDTLAGAKRGNGSGTGVAHSAGAYWAVCGVAMPYNTDFTLSPHVRGDRLWNHPQRFFGFVGSDIAARNTPQYGIEGDPMLYDLKEQTLLQKWYLERAIVSGQRLTGNADAADPLPHKMGGIDYFISNHSGRVNNLGGRTLSAYDLEDVLRDMFKEIDDGGAKTMLMGPDTAAIFDTLLNPVRQATVTDTKVNLVVDKVKFRWGELEIMPTQHMPEGSILFVDFKDIAVHPYKGCAWSTKTVATGGPYDRMAIWGDYTLTVKRVQRMGKIWNFNTNLSNYPRREFW